MLPIVRPPPEVVGAECAAALWNRDAPALLPTSVSEISYTTSRDLTIGSGRRVPILQREDLQDRGEIDARSASR
jgi:hypothetical protein